jgi:hypothetical protein
MGSTRGKFSLLLPRLINHHEPALGFIPPLVSNTSHPLWHHPFAPFANLLVFTTIQPWAGRTGWFIQRVTRALLHPYRTWPNPKYRTVPLPWWTAHFLFSEQFHYFHLTVWHNHPRGCIWIMCQICFFINSTWIHFLTLSTKFITFFNIKLCFCTSK